MLKKELIQHLRSKRCIHRSRHSRAGGQSRGQIVDAISIRERPAEIEDRAIPGHWQGDLLAGTRNSHIATLVERHSRFTILVKVPSKDTATLCNTARCCRTTVRSSCDELTEKWDEPVSWIGETIAMKKPSQHLIAEVPRSVTKVGMTIGIDLGDVWSHYCTLNEDGEVVDRGGFARHSPESRSGLPICLGRGLRWRLEPIRSGSANNSENWATK
nr:hypothetical protein [Acidobacterium sp. S8]